MSCPTSGGGWRHEQRWAGLGSGATSAIAHAYGRRRAERGASCLPPAAMRCICAPMRPISLRGVRRRLPYGASIWPGRWITMLVVADLMVSEGSPVEVLFAYGVLEQQDRSIGDVAYARDLIETNFTSVVCWLLAIIARWDRSRSLTLVVIGSVAGDRGRGNHFLLRIRKRRARSIPEGLQQALHGY